MASPNKSVDLLASRIVVPDHVVRREFAAETVVLNLRTSKYHGLNPTAGRMLEELEASETISAAAKVLAKEYGLPADEMQDDLVVLCRQMLERELIEVAAPTDG